MRCLSRIRWCGIALIVLAGVRSPAFAGSVLPGLASNLVCHYDFEHPVPDDAAWESDLGPSRTAIHLVNGGSAMRVADGAYPGSRHSLQTKQVHPDRKGNDDWKAGVYHTNGVASLHAFASATGITLMGWVKPTGVNPAPNSATPNPADRYNAIGLFGLLSGSSQGHDVRALVEVIQVGGSYRLVALGRRLDDGQSLILAATNDWHSLLPDDTWTHLASSFDFERGTMALYRNGSPVVAAMTSNANLWQVGPDRESGSDSDPAGIKIGGSYPQNTSEKNAFDGRFDDLMFFNRVLSPSEVQQQYRSFLTGQDGPGQPER